MRATGHRHYPWVSVSFFRTRFRKDCSMSACCLHCSLKQHLGPGQKCEGTAKCINCQGNHRTLDRSCPVYRKAESINGIMACDNLPYVFARRCYENSSGQVRFSEKQMDFPSLPSDRGGTTTGNTQSPLQTHQNGRIQKPWNQTFSSVGRNASKSVN